jgi:hypothetical protein
MDLGRQCGSSASRGGASERSRDRTCLVGHTFYLNLFAVHVPRCNIVIAPRRFLAVSSLVLLVLFRPLFRIVMPGVEGLIGQLPLPFLDFANGRSVLGATPTDGCGTGGAQGESLAALALKYDVLRMPLVTLAERDLTALVVRFDVLDDPLHLLTPFCHLNVLGKDSVVPPVVVD